MKNLDLGGRLLRSSSAATLSQAWRVGVTFATQMVLRRVVAPDDWGDWHWALDFVFVLLGQVRDVGVPAHMVRDRERPYGNFLAVEAFWGLVLTVAVLVASPWLATLGPQGSSHLVPILQGLAVFFFIEGIGKIPLTYFEAELLIDRAVVPELARNLCFAALAVTLALWGGYGVYSMLIAHVTASAVFTGMLWWRAWGKMPLTWIRGGTWPLLRHSAPLMPMAMVILAVDVVDYALVGLIFPSSLVGIYGGALMLSLMVPRVLEWPLRRALYPAFVAVRDDAARFFETYRLSTILLMAVHVTVGAFFFVNAELILTVLWGELYREAVPFLRVLAFVPLVQPFARCSEDVLLPRHQEKLLTIATVTNLLALVVFAIFLMAEIGAVGMPLAKLLPLGSLLIAWAIYSIDPRRFWHLVLDLLAVYGVPAALFAVVWLATPGGGYFRLVASVAAGLASAAAYYFLFRRAFLDFFRRLPSAED